MCRLRSSHAGNNVSNARPSLRGNSPGTQNSVGEQSSDGVPIRVINASKLAVARQEGKSSTNVTTDAPPYENVSVTMYVLILRHGLLILVLAVLCGVSFFAGVFLIPLFCERRPQGQVYHESVSRYPQRILKWRKGTPLV